ncbi:MAG: glycerate kinase [Anaerovoracaceae bacterium]|nr:glycerate kinase [Anaerovoracaceae bacterium]
MDQLRKDAERIVHAGINAVMPDAAVKKALKNLPDVRGRLFLVAAGKAAWQMAKAATDIVDPDRGIVITKYDHVKGELPGIICREAGHPVPDHNGFEATREAIDMVSRLSKDDLVLFLLSGGGSALFEDPLVSGEELKDITQQLLDSGANITEINTIRKRLSRVKGGRFAEICSPAKVFTIVLSDIIGDPLDMIASGPAAPDSASCRDAISVLEKYNLNLSDHARALLNRETPKRLDNVTTHITGSVTELCKAVAAECESMGYRAVFLTDKLDCEAREAGQMLGDYAARFSGKGEKTAFIAGGETVVHITGRGKGGRNQETALAAAPLIAGLNCAVFSFGSDGTDGPTDAAGGFVDGNSMDDLKNNGIDITKTLSDNDSYHALKSIGGLIITGPTGTNVNDAAVALIPGI